MPFKTDKEQHLLIEGVFLLILRKLNEVCDLLG
jgi:hypothetical protein